MHTSKRSNGWVIRCHKDGAIKLFPDLYYFITFTTWSCFLNSKRRKLTCLPRENNVDPVPERAKLLRYGVPGFPSHHHRILCSGPVSLLVSNIQVQGQWNGVLWIPDPVGFESFWPNFTRSEWTRLTKFDKNLYNYKWYLQNSRQD